MFYDRANRRMKTRRAAVLLTTAAALFASLDVSLVRAQSIMRTPNLNIGSRVPSINPTVTPRIDPNIAGRANNIGVAGIDRTAPRVTTNISTMRTTPRIGVTSTLPHTRYSPNLYPACAYAYRDSSGECGDQPVTSVGGGGGKSATNKNKKGGSNRDAPQTALNLRTVTGELVAELDSSLSDAQADELARRHRLERIGSQDFPLTGSTVGLFRIVDG